jgi:hypothetical protein
MKNIVLFTFLLIVSKVSVSQPTGNSLVLNGYNDFVEIPDNNSLDLKCFINIYLAALQNIAIY